MHGTRVTLQVTRVTVQGTGVTERPGKLGECAFLLMQYKCYEQCRSSAPTSYATHWLLGCLGVRLELGVGLRLQVGSGVWCLPGWGIDGRLGCLGTLTAGSGRHWQTHRRARLGSQLGQWAALPSCRSRRAVLGCPPADSANSKQLDGSGLGLGLGPGLGLGLGLLLTFTGRTDMYVDNNVFGRASTVALCSTCLDACPSSPASVS